MPIGFEVTVAGDYTISRELDYIDSSFEILLEDTLLNTMTDMRTLDYTFNMTSPTEDNSRFIMHYNYNAALGTDDIVYKEKNIKATFLNDELLTSIYLDNLPNSLQIFDMTGREVLNTNFSDRVVTRNLSSGIYIVKYSFENKKHVSKKVIKK